MSQTRVHHLVLFEFAEARSWYAGRSPLAAVNFSLRFHAALARIEANPRSQAPWRSIFRRVRLVRFPYLLLFHADRRYTSVLALVHSRRDPLATVSETGTRLAQLG